MKRVLGVVSKLWRYPVKSMLGESCACLDLNSRGVVGDRIFAVRDNEGKFGSGKTTRRFRQIDGLFEFRASYRDGVLVITCPDGRRLTGNDGDVGAILSDPLGQSVDLVREDAVSHLDAAPVHLLSTGSMAWLKAALPDAVIDERRFRPNLLVDVSAEIPVEESWLGETVRIGPEVRLRISDFTERCRMVTLAQGDLPADPRILQQIVRKADLQFGVYAEVIAAGRIACGDKIVSDGIRTLGLGIPA